MKLACPDFSDVIVFDGISTPSIVIENRSLFRTIVYKVLLSIEGCDTDLVLSKNEKIIDMSKNAELLTDFINFDINKKSLLNKVVAELEKSAASPEHYLKTQELLAELDRRISEWAFQFPCDIISSKISVSALLKSAGIEVRNEYEGHVGEVEKVLDYMELVREFDKDKLFITVNMRTFFDDSIMQEFLKTVSSHEFNVLMLESQSYPLLDFEKRTTIDSDLCEF